MSGKTPVIVISSVIIVSTLLAAALSYEHFLPRGRPVDVVSIEGPIAPYNPGGPVVMIVVKDVSNTPVTDLNVILYLSGSTAGAYQFTFGLSTSNPLMPGQTAQSTRTLIGAGFSSSQDYPLRINTTLQNGTAFSYILQVQIALPS